MKNILLIIKQNGIVKTIQGGSFGYILADIDSEIIITDTGFKKDAILMEIFRAMDSRRNTCSSGFEVLYIH